MRVNSKRNKIIYAYNDGVGREYRIYLVQWSYLKEKKFKTTRVNLSKMYSTRQSHSQNWIQVTLITEHLSQAEVQCGLECEIIPQSRKLNDV